ncbi:related to RIO Kinase 1 [Sporisorium reilianum SRZ2]|uniref:Serine/threonine-protein kinase RIO1 n=1 Tax=Sporisorium reilianum (strain SRZ2) TaxID=999809 RepID=E6ZQT4_SPORE|nr:related to RIO Kinase 1 [Sporisorium reilianum SRZ2]
MEAGQFDDAPDQGSIEQQQQQQQKHLQAAQDEDTAQSQQQRRQEISDLLRPASDAEDSEEEDDLIEEEEEEEEDYDEDDATGYGAVEDADWELARGDFTKQFNRSRQLANAINASSSTASASTSKSSAAASSATPLPAMNRRRRPAPSSTASTNKQSPATAAVAGPSTGQTRTASQMESLSKFASRVRVDDMYDPSSAIGGGVNSTVPRKALGGRDAVRIKDKADRATVEGVLDPRTMVILYKMVNRGLLESVNGCVSTGKEANVYHATTAAASDEADQGSLALKIYKTSILVFKDRDRYVSGEFRFRHGYAKHNPRKMVRLWAEKEARNLKRMVSAGLRAPVPVELRDHVLVMQFLGDADGWASPRLKDADEMIGADPDVWARLYRELLASVRIMYHECRLVHADLSEYNILYHEGHLWIIDVSQSVEHDHPRAYDFLRADLGHVDEYFAKRGVHTLGLRRSFEFVVSEPKGGEAAARKGGRAGLEKQDADFHEDDAPNPNAAHDAELQLQVSAPTSTADKSGPTPVQAAAAATPQNRVIGGGAWYTGLSATSAAAPSAPSAPASLATGESEASLMHALEQLMHQLSIEPEAEPTIATTSAATPGADGSVEKSANGDADDEVFKATYIPFSLHEVDDPEREIELQNNKTRQSASQEEGSFATLLPAAQSGSAATAAHDNGAEASHSDPGSDSDSDSDSHSDDDDDETPIHPKDAKLTKEQAKALKKQAKKETKEANREKRKTKMPKAEKKRRMKKSHK